MSWLKGDTAEVAPRIKGYPGIWDKLRTTVGNTRVMTGRYGDRIRYKKMRETFWNLKEDMRPIQVMNKDMIIHYLRQPWSMS